MKLAICNDTHFGARQDSPIFNEFFFKFWEETFFPYLKTHGINTIVHLGDFVDRRKFIAYPTLNQVRTRFLDRIRNEGFFMHVLVGNHDIPFKNNNEINAVNELFSLYKDNIKIYPGPTEVDFDGIPIAFIPWINEDNESDTKNLIKTCKSDVCFGHLEIAGFEMDRGNVCHDGVDRSMFNKFDIVLSGHFHHKSTDGHIFYLGNQYEITWADCDDPRGFHIFDTETRELKFIQNPYKMFHKIKYDDLETMSFEHLNSMDLSVYKDTCVKILVVNKSNPFLFDKFLERLQKEGPLDISIDDFTILESEVTDEEITQAEDTPAILKSYVDGLEIDGEKEILYNVLYDLYISAQNTEQV